MRFDDQVAVAALEVEAAVGAGEVVEARQVDVLRTQAQLEIFELLEWIEGCLGLQWRVLQQQRATLEVRDPVARLVTDIGEVVEAGVDLVCAQFHLGIGGEVVKADAAVYYPQLVERDR